MIRFGEEAARRLAEVENRDALLAELKAQEAKDATAYRRAAEELTEARTAAAGRLEKLAVAEINDLAMQVKFRWRWRTRRRCRGGRRWVGPDCLPDCYECG